MNEQMVYQYKLSDYELMKHRAFVPQNETETALYWACLEIRQLREQVKEMDQEIISLDQQLAELGYYP